MDPAFAGAGKAPGLAVWRIESFKPVRVDEGHIGQFYSGDSYLVLASRSTSSGALAHDIYIWIGSESSIDEAGTAAIKAVELDDSLGQIPIQHREEQGTESGEFLSLFKAFGGVIHLNGGVASGFHHVEAESYSPALLHVKGKRNVLTRQVPVAASSLNAGDVFILDLGFTLYLYAGAQANTLEKAKGVEVMARLHSSRGGKTDRIIIADATDAQKTAFWSALKGSESDVAPATPDDVAGADSFSSADVKLFKVSDASGTLAVTEISRNSEGRLTRELLPVGDVALVDIGTEVFVWISKTASDAERKNGLKYATEYLQKANRSNARSTVVREGGETATFKALFYHWDPPASFDFTRKSTGVASSNPTENTNFAELVSSSGAAALPTATVPNVTTTSVSAWIVQGTTVSKLSDDKVGEFFAGDSFVVQQDFTDTKGNKGSTFYFWLGRHSDNIERGTAALTARDLADAALAAAKGGKSSVTQVRVVQGSEPPQFAQAFNGTLIIHAGGAQGSLQSASAAHLYHIKGSTVHDTKAVEVNAAASSLNSGDAFVLILPTAATAYLWLGKGSNDTERQAASQLADRLVHAWNSKAAGLKVVKVDEGAEPADFWSALGGKADYPATVPLPAIQMGRLFEVSDASGALSVTEVHNWSQSDLLEDETVLLDAGTQVFVWIGSQASPAERGRAIEVAEKYVAAAAAAGRLDAHVPIVRVESGSEPPSFTAQFAGWDHEATAELADPYEAKMAELKAQREAEKDKVAAHAAELEAKRAKAIADAEAKAHGSSNTGDHSSAVLTEKASHLKHVEVTHAASSDAHSSATITAAASHLKHTGSVVDQAPAPTSTSSAPIHATGPVSGVTVTYNGATYPIEELKLATNANPGQFAGANLSEKETLISANDFPAVFGMSQADFAKLPKWKQQDAKKKVGLF